MIVYYSSERPTNLIQPPESVLRQLIKDSENVYTKQTLVCPAITNFYKNIYAIYPSYYYRLSYNGCMLSTPLYDQIFFDDHVGIRNCSNTDTCFFSYFDPPIVFFTEEKSLIMETLPVSNHLVDNRVNFLMGSYDVGKHLRKIECPLVIKKNEVFEVRRDTPLYYVKFNTEKKIIFKRFIYTEEMSNLAKGVSFIRGYSTKPFNLDFFYNLTKTYNLKKKYLEIIKKNLID